MASAGGHCHHVNHVTTQIPYALTVAVVCCIGYALIGVLNAAGMLGISWIALPVCVVIMLGWLLVLRKKFGREDI